MAKRGGINISATMVKTSPFFIRQKAQVMVETALAIPILLMFLFSMIYFARLFYLKQIVFSACQTAAQTASQYNNLNDPNVYGYVKGFSQNGQALNLNSPVYQILSSASLLTNAKTGNLPPGAGVYLLPTDTQNYQNITVAPNAIGVLINYPLNILGNNQNINLSLGFGAPLTLPVMTITEFASYPLQVSN